MADRNRDILTAFEIGQTIEQISQDHNLTESHIRAILTAEKNRQKFSPEAHYRQLRKDTSEAVT